jgi:hypothetical protein
MRFQPLTNLRLVPSTYSYEIVTRVNSPMSNGLEAKERRPISKIAEEERELFKFQLIKRLEMFQ